MEYNICNYYAIWWQISESINVISRISTLALGVTEIGLITFQILEIFYLGSNRYSNILNNTNIRSSSHFVK